VYRAASVLYILHVYDFRKRADGEYTDSGSGPRQHLHVPGDHPAGRGGTDFPGNPALYGPRDRSPCYPSKRIYGYLVIPNQFEADATAGRDATLSYYYHYALLSVGGEVRGAFETLLRTLSLAPVVVQATAMGLGENQITTFLLPVRSSSHPLFNPDLDYSVYLSNPFFFVFFQVIIFAGYGVRYR